MIIPTADKGLEPRAIRTGLFVVTSAARTGSTLLVNLLQSHPDVLCHMEIFHPERVEGFSGRLRARLVEETDIEPRLRSLRRDRPETFLHKVAFDADGRKAVGFKFKYDEMLMPRFSGARAVLMEDTDIGIVHLRRRNLVARYLSWWIVNNVTHVTMVREGEARPHVDPVTVDPVACRADIEETERRAAFVARMFRGHKRIEIDYEDLTGPDAAAVARRLLAFLGLADRPLRTVLARLAEAPLRERIANYDELRRAFAGTPHARHLEEAA